MGLPGVSVSLAIGVTTIAIGLGLYSVKWPPNAIVKDNATFDYIIIGSGAGSVVANRLTEESCLNVLLIEAGKKPSVESMLAGAFTTLQNTYQDYNFKSEPELASQSQSGDVFKISAGKTLGGSSQINHFIYLRGDPTDFDFWAEVTNDSSWNYESVLPYFLKAETMKDEEIMTSEYAVYHNTTGPIILTIERYNESEKYLTSFKEAGQVLRIDLNGRKTHGYAQPALTNNEVRQSEAEGYLKPIADRENLKVIYESTVTKINIDDDNNAVSVDVLVGGKTKTFYACREIILSAGVFNSPKLLMLSGVGPKDHLESLNIPVKKDLPVGQNLKDHLAVQFLHKMEKSRANSLQIPDLTKLGIPIILGGARIDNTVEYPQYQTTSLIIPPDSPILLAVCAQLFGYKIEICEKLQYEAAGWNIFYSLVACIDCKFQGNVTLKSQNPQDDPTIRLNYYSVPSDEDAMDEYIENYLKVQNTTYFKSVNSTLVNLTFDDCKGDFPSEEYRKCYKKHMTGSLYHYFGTCSMGSVVDSELKVKGIRKLRVVDASIIPKIRANPNAATIMVAEKASDMIKADLISKLSKSTNQE